MSPISWVVFDLGGVLVEADNHRLISSLAKFGGLDEDFVLKNLSQASDFWLRYGTTPLTVRDVTPTFNALLGTTLTEAQIQIATDAELGPEITPSVDLLATLKGRVKTACLSNTHAPHWEKLKRDYRFLQMMDITLASQEMGCRKPDKQIYRMTVERLGTTPEQILFFDDRPENIETARVEGWHAVQVHGPADVSQAIHRYFPHTPPHT